ncbi:MAG TPA: caspase family protein [Methanothrix sp.]|nr:caspase family protein [Methanothrix sp.]
MKIACLLGVSKYKNPYELKACDNDTALLYSVLESTGCYDDILRIDGNQESSKVKRQLVSFFTKYKEQQIEQALFYYSGHGDFDGKEFFYLLSDYDHSRKKQTTIENTELDDWIRLLNPDLTVKIIDACHAGVQYIKDPDVFAKFLQSTPKSFKSCYFLFSSLKDQYSYQDENLSAFTKSVVMSISSFDGTEMRFKDIIDYVSDDFDANAEQTPFFITQATNTELFATVDSSIIEKIHSYLNIYCPMLDPSEKKDTNHSVTQSASIIELVKADSERYCSEEEVLSILKHCQTYLSEKKYSDDTLGLYDIETEGLDHIDVEVPRIVNIGKWLSENKNDYFAVPTYREENYDEVIEVPVKNISSLFASITQKYETRTVTRSRNVLAGFRLTQETDSSAFRITAKPKLLNLNWHDCHIAFVFSKVEIRFFYIFSTFREQNWEKRNRQPEENWRTLVALLKNDKAVGDALQQIIETFDDYIMEPIKSKYLRQSKCDEQ